MEQIDLNSEVSTRISVLTTNMTFCEENLITDQTSSKTPILTILNKFCANNVRDYVFHTRVLLEYDEEDAFVFIFKNSIVFTHLYDDKESEIKKNPIIYIIKFQQLYFFDLQINESDGNHIIIQFYENCYVKKSELKLKFNFLKDSYFIHHFIKKYYILYWQKIFEESVLQTQELKAFIYNYHFYVKKLNRWGKNQDRLLLVTDKFIFNLTAAMKKDTFKVEKLKWADSIRAINKVGVILNKTCEMRLYYEKDINTHDHKSMNVNKKLLKVKKSRDFIFLNTNDRNYFLFLIRQSFFKLTKAHLAVEGIKIS